MSGSYTHFIDFHFPRGILRSQSRVERIPNWDLVTVQDQLIEGHMADYMVLQSNPEFPAGRPWRQKKWAAYAPWHGVIEVFVDESLVLRTTLSNLPFRVGPAESTCMFVSPGSREATIVIHMENSAQIRSPMKYRINLVFDSRAA